VNQQATKILGPLSGIWRRICAVEATALDRSATGNVSRSLSILVIGIWFVLVVTGFAFLAVYSNTDGAADAPPQDVDFAALSLPTVSGKYHLVMAVHPKCPCTRASINELNRIAAKCGDDLTYSFLIYRPEYETVDWAQSGTVVAVGKMPGAILVPDPSGKIAARLGMKTSGSTVLFDPSGASVFYGGITAARNHEGDNLGSDAVVSFVRNGSADRNHAPVFGCPIHLDSCAEDHCQSSGGSVQ
jgi:hypothetical protein